MAEGVREAVADDAPAEHRGHDVFVSYSRADRETVVSLTQGLSARGKRPWVDLQDIPPSAEWMSEIRAAIDAADGYLVVISPDSAASKVCATELEHAKQAGKRIVPVLVRATDPATVPAALASLNWIDATDGDLGPALERIVQALDTDLEHVKAHTRLLVRASEWQHKVEDRSLLLRGQDLKQAEALLVSAQGKDPAPTPVQARFVQASRQASSRRQRTMIGAVALALAVSLVLSVVAVIQRGEAVDQRAVADEQRALAEERAAESRSRELAAASVGQLEIDPELSLLLALEAIRSSETSEAIEALRLALTESRIRATFVGHDGAVLASSLSPDGAWLLTAGSDGTARIWDVAATSEPLLLSGHTDLIESASFSPDGSRVVTASFDGTARVSDPTGGEVVAVLGAGEGAIHDAAFDPTGERVVTAGGDGRVDVWDAGTGERILVLRGHAGPVYDVEFSPTGRYVVTASDDDTARVFDTRTGRTVHVLRGHEDGLYVARFSPDGGTIVTASEDGTAKLWDVASGRAIADLLGHRGAVVGAAFRMDGSLVATASEDSTARIWDATDGQLVSVLRGHEDELNTVAFSPDGSLVVTSSNDGSASVWDPVDGTRAAVLRGHSGDVISATFAPDGLHVLTGGKDGTARLWQPLTGQVVFDEGVSWASRSPDGARIAITTLDGRVVVIDTASGREIVTLGAGAPQTLAAFTADPSLVASAGYDGVGHVWDLPTGEQVAELTGHDAFWTGPDQDAWSDDLLTYSDDGTARLWDPRSGRELMTFDHGMTGGVGIWMARLTQDGTRVFTTGTLDGTIRMWDATSGEELWKVDGLLGIGGIGAVLSPDGELAASAAVTTTIWEVESGREVAMLADPSRIAGAAFSPDGRTIVTRSDDGGVRAWDPRTGEILGVMTNGPGTVNNVGFSDDGRWVVAASEDAAVRVWDRTTGELVASLGLSRAANAFFAAPGSTIVSHDEQVVRIDRCDACGTLEDLLPLAETRVTRALTDAERAEYLESSPDGETDVAAARPAGLADAGGAPVRDGALAPGRYTAVGFTPTLRFTVGDGWYAGTDIGWAKEGEVQTAISVVLLRADEPSDGLVFVHLDPGRLVDGRKGWDERRNIVPFPRDMAAWFEAHPNLEVLGTSRVTIAGIDAVAVDTRVTSVPDIPPPFCGTCLAMLPLTLRHETGPVGGDDLVWSLSPGEIDRWILLDTPQGAILVNPFSSSRAHFEEFLPLVDEVLETVQIGT